MHKGVKMATETQNVAEEIQNEEVIHPPQQQVLQSQEAHEPVTQQDENDKDYNFRQLREGKKQLEEEVKQLKRQMDGLAQQQASNQTRDEDSMEIGDDDLVEGRHVKKLMSQVEKMFQQREAETIPERLKARFSDFDEVVSKENIENLRDTEPELYRTITAGNDLFAKGISAYKTLKSMGIYQPKEDYIKRKDNVHSNHNKPMSVQAIKGQGALHEANIFAQGLTPDLKKQLQKEMEAAIKAQ